MLLRYEELPEDIQKGYEGPYRVHKAEKKGTSTIIVHTKSRTKDTWKKSGEGWIIPDVAKKLVDQDDL